MSKLTCVATVTFFEGEKPDQITEDINREIKDKMKEGYSLRGTPTPVGDEYVILTFEMEDNNEGNIIDEISKEIPEDR